MRPAAPWTRYIRPIERMSLTIRTLHPPVRRMPLDGVLRAGTLDELVTVSVSRVRFGEGVAA